MTHRDKLFYGLTTAFAAALSYTIPLIFLMTPSAQEAAGGLAQKIFYFHMPVAIAVYVTGAVCFVASAIYSVKPSEEANAWARAGADCAALFGTLVLCSGPVWAK
jgi:heme exporter protein C